MGIKKIVMILASLSFSVAALADHHEGENKPFTITGDFAASIQFHDNEGNHATPLNPSTGPNFGHDEFNLNLMNIGIEKNWSKSSLVMSIGYGTTAAGMFDATALNLLDAYYQLSSDYGLTFQVGRFEAPFGIETYNHRKNSTFTRSYGFLLTPFFQVGANVNYSGGDMWNAGLIVSNGQGAHRDANDNNKTFAVTVDVDPMENLGFDLNFITGTEANATSGNTQLNTIDFSAAYMINEMFDVALNYVQMTTKAKVTGATDETASSVAAYVNAHLGMADIGLRYEQFSYDDGAVFANGFPSNVAAATNVGGIGGAVTGTDNSISSITVAASTEIDQNARVMFEYRMDSSDDKIWTNKDATNAEDAQNTMTLGLMYNF